MVYLDPGKTTASDKGQKNSDNPTCLYLACSHARNPDRLDEWIQQSQMDIGNRTEAQSRWKLRERMHRQTNAKKVV